MTLVPRADSISPFGPELPEPTEPGYNLRLIADLDELHRALRSILDQLPDIVDEVNNLGADVVNITTTVQNIQEVTNITNEGDTIIDEFKKHAWTHSKGGNDPMAPWPQEWFKTTEFFPSSTDIRPIYLEAKPEHTADWLLFVDSDLAYHFQVGPGGQVGVNAASLNAELNVRAGIVQDPDSIDNLVFWFNADDISGETDGQPMTGIWNDRTGSYTATPDNYTNVGPPDNVNAIYRFRTVWGKSAAAVVDCCVAEGAGENGAATSGSIPPGEFNISTNLGNRRWFNLSPSYAFLPGVNYTLVYVGRVQFQPILTSGSGIIGTKGSGILDGYFQQAVRPYGWTFSWPASANPVYPFAKFGEGSDVKYAQPWTSRDPFPTEGAGGTGMGYWQQLIITMEHIPVGNGRRFNKVLLNGVDKTTDPPAEVPGSPQANFTITGIAGTQLETAQVMLFARELSDEEITQLSNWLTSYYSVTGPESDYQPEDEFLLAGGSSGGDIFQGQLLDNSTVVWIDGGGFLGLGKDPQRILHIRQQDLTKCHIRLEYDADNYVDLLVDDDGVLSFDHVGTTGISRVAYKIPKHTALPAANGRQREPFILNRQASSKGDALYFSLQKHDGTWAWASGPSFGGAGGGF